MSQHIPNSSPPPRQYPLLPNIIIISYNSYQTRDLIKTIPIDNPKFPWNYRIDFKKKKHASPAVGEFIRYISAELPFHS